MKRFKYLIMANSYNPNIGGYVVLHRLCHELNKLGCVARMVPAFNNHVFNKDDMVVPLLRFAKERLRRMKGYETNPDFLTPVWSEEEFRASVDDWVVVYPETISGNPLGARHVVRWFLHHPGFHRSDFYYGLNELYFKYHPGIVVPKDLQANTSPNGLHIIHYPLNLYNMEGCPEKRSGSAYAVRKGVGKKMVHDLKGSFLIDGKSHEEISSIFKSVEVFYSYDPYTAYSTFAALCGCDSVVVPDEGMSEDKWYPEKNFRLGIAYGVDRVVEARNERAALLSRVETELASNSRNVERFLNEVNAYF